MKKVELYVPKVEDLWFREQMMSDPKTMEYNAGYDVSYDGYHYDTGCIDFPKEIHQTWYETKMSNANFYFAYIQDVDSNEYVGYLNFNKFNENTATMGIVINSKFKGQGFMRPAMLQLFEEARKRGVEKLTDTVPNVRENALKVFFDMGFVKESEFIGKKFGKDEIVYCIEKVLN